MVNSLFSKKFIIIVWGMITALALFGIFQTGMNPELSPTIGNILVWSYLAIPVVILLIAIYRVKKTKNRRFLTYAISVLISIIAIPILFFIGLLLVVVIFGVMPTPT